MSYSFQVRFVAFRDRPIHERIAKFNHSIREGNVELVSEKDTTEFSNIYPTNTNVLFVLIMFN